MTIEKLEALAAKATPGPWHISGTRGRLNLRGHIISVVPSEDGDGGHVCDTLGTSDADAALIIALVNDALPLIRKLQAENDALKAEVARLSKPEWFYNVEDPEYSGGDVQDVVNDMDREGVMHVAGAREVWRKWVAIRCVKLDYAGDIDDVEAAEFDTVEEAEACWSSSLAQARASRSQE